MSEVIRRVSHWSFWGSLPVLSVPILCVPAVGQQVVDTTPHLHSYALGTGPATVIVIHGGPGLRHDYLRPEWDRLADRFRVVYYDQRGCGLSAGLGPGTWEQHVEDLDVLVRRYRKLGTVYLAGSSWGAWLAILYSISHEHRVSGLVVTGFPPWPEPGDSAQFAHLNMPDLDSATAAATAALDQGIALRLGATCGKARAQALASLSRVPPLSTASRITEPVLVVDGDRPSPTGNGSSSLVAVLKNVTRTTIAGTGHDPWYEDPGTFFSAVCSFLLANGQRELPKR